MDKFDHLLFELGNLLDVELHPDSNRSCLLVINDEYRVQLEMDKSEEALIFGSIICEIPPGKFRENVLKDSLKYNNLPPPRFGNLGYIEKINCLSLFDTLPIHSLKAQLVSEHLNTFIEKVILWKKAIQSNQTLPQEIANQLTQVK